MLAENARQQMLRAIGVSVYVLRSRTPIAALQATVPAVPVVASSSARPEAPVAPAPLIAIICERAAPTAARERLLADIRRALRVPRERIAWLYATAQALESDPPEVSAWLVLGPKLASTLGARLSTKVQIASCIAVAALPEDCVGDSAGKRALWQALKPLLRARA
jgi:hypothetical protein